VAFRAIRFYIYQSGLGWSKIVILLQQTFTFESILIIHASKTEWFFAVEAHSLHSHSTGSDYQISPTQPVSKHLFHWIKQCPGLVQMSVVAPTPLWFEPDSATMTTTFTIGFPVSSCAMPGQTYKERAVVPAIGRPTCIGSSQNFSDANFDSLNIQFSQSTFICCLLRSFF